MSHLHWITPQWDAPENIRVVVTTRLNGVSHAPYESLNLGVHVGDELQSVLKNRALVKNKLHLQNEPYWLSQVHSTNAVYLSSMTQQHAPIEADASFTDYKNTICTVMTADCLPILVTNKQGTWVAAIHAGWRGLLNGVIEKTLIRYLGNPHDLLIYLGPAISQMHFEVGEEVYHAFLQQNIKAAEAFKPSAQHRHKFYADLFLLAKQRCFDLGISESQIFGGTLCTYTNQHEFYSYRRDGQTGRFASLIWIQ